jgi:hypothetical protein
MAVQCRQLAGRTNTSLMLVSAGTTNAGNYSVAVVMNGYGSVTSAPASLTLVTPPDFLWARNVTNTIADHSGISSARHAAIDASGNVFVAGYYQGWGVDFGGAC